MTDDADAGRSGDVPFGEHRPVVELVPVADDEIARRPVPMSWSGTQFLPRGSPGPACRTVGAHGGDGRACRPISTASSGVRVLLLPEPMLIPPLRASLERTERLLAPIEVMVFIRALREPWLISTIAITAPTPMMIPSVVSAGSHLVPAEGVDRDVRSGDGTIAVSRLHLCAGAGAELVAGAAAVLIAGATAAAVADVRALGGAATATPPPSDSEGGRSGSRSGPLAPLFSWSGSPGNPGIGRNVSPAPGGVFLDEAVDDPDDAVDVAGDLGVVGDEE